MSSAFRFKNPENNLIRFQAPPAPAANKIHKFTDQIMIHLNNNNIHEVDHDIMDIWGKGVKGRRGVREGVKEREVEKGDGAVRRGGGRKRVLLNDINTYIRML